MRTSVSVGSLVLLWATSFQTSGIAHSPGMSVRLRVVSSSDLAPVDTNQRPPSISGFARTRAHFIGLDVDRIGNAYLAIASRTGPEQFESQVLKYNSTGALVSSFELPSVVRSSEAINLTSVTSAGRQVYVTASWKDATVGVQGGVLIFTNTGKYIGMLSLPPRFTPDRVLVTATRGLYVLGTGPRLVNGRYVYSGSDMILKLSPSGKLLASFSPVAANPSDGARQVQGIRQNCILLDSANRLVHVLNDATIRIFSSDGQLQKMITPSLFRFDSLTGAFLVDGLLVLATMDVSKQQARLAVVDWSGRVLSQSQTSDTQQITAQGKDGYYYGVISLASRQDSVAGKIRLNRMKLELAK